jgi:hypothetical protein
MHNRKAVEAQTRLPIALIRGICRLYEAISCSSYIPVLRNKSTLWCRIADPDRGIAEVEEIVGVCPAKTCRLPYKHSVAKAALA